MKYYIIPCRWCSLEIKSTSKAKMQYCGSCTAIKDGGNRKCIDCGEACGWYRNPRCSACRYNKAKAEALKAGKLCAECQRPATAAGLCSTHYSYKHRETNPRNAQREAEQRKANAREKVCDFCLRTFKSAESRSRCCSSACAQRLKNGWSTSKEIVLRRSHERMTRTWVGHTIPPRAGKPMVSGPCTWCGTQYTGTPGSVYCSNQCAGRASWKRVYDRRGEFKVSDRVRDAIYARDGWTCQLCGDPVSQGLPHGHRLYPTLDHIIPQSLSEIPDHSPSNLRLAHLVCNSRRGNRMDYDITA